MTSPILTDAEIDEICAGLVQGAAKVRYLRDVLRVAVERKPNGRPLVRRADWDRRQPPVQDDAPTRGPKWTRPLP